MPLFGKKKPSEHWYLEGYLGEGKTWLIELAPLPFVIGRQRSCHLRLSSLEVSRRHAEIYQREGELWLKEFGSKNGTFVNRQRLAGEQHLHNGDILHFGPIEFRIHLKQAALTAGQELSELLTTNISGRELSSDLVNYQGPLNELLHQAAVTPYFQPIARLTDQQTVAYELLGRGNHQQLPINPWPMLQIARRLHKEVELSELFRQVGVQQASQLGLVYPLFTNTVPDEVDVDYLQRSLQALRSQAPSLPLVVEIHETTVTDLKVMKNLRALLRELEIGLAYDDFGAGQGRLMELMAAPPDYLKFDKEFIRQAYYQPPPIQQALHTLVQMAQNLGITTIAEGIEDEKELNTCAHLGFDLAQGYYLGRPAPSLLDTAL
jgi:EAL domain-containing protein (putative c-di-GMP-specific phosphodiesterase class I)